MRHWRSFSIRTLMLLITACCCGLAWIAAERAQTARETAAAKYFEDRDCSLIHGREYAPREGALQWLLGDNRAAQHRDAHLTEAGIADADVAKLHDLPLITDVFLDEHHTDEALRHLRGHPGVTMVMGLGSKITDTGLVHVRTLPRLDELYLDYTLVTGSGFIHLEGMRLKRLSLAGTQLRDEELRHLQRMVSLSELDIAATPITDAGLRHLHSISSLKKVRIEVCPVTKSGVAKLRAALPGAIVQDEPEPGEVRGLGF